MTKGTGESEVRGIWFAAAAAYCAREFGDQTLKSVLGQMPAPHRDALLFPDGNTWYPEAVMQTAIAAMDRVLAEGDPVRFTRIIEGCTEEGVSRAFRVFLRVTTPAFVLRQVPFMWRQIRRGRGDVAVVSSDASALIQYRDFPYFEDRRYRRLTEASLRALVRIATRREPDVQIIAYDDCSLDIEVRYFA